MAATPAASHSRSRTAARTETLSVGDAAWLLALPCALIAILAMIVLGPTLGSVLFPPRHVAFLIRLVKPEPTEHARFLLAVLAPVTLAALVAGPGRHIGSEPRRRVTILALQALPLILIAVSIVALHVVTYDGVSRRDVAEHRVYFTPATLVAAAAIAAGLVALLRRPGAERLWAPRDTRARAIAAWTTVAVLVAAWMLTAFNTDGTIGLTNPAVRENVPYWLDETFAVLNGLAPLSTFHAQYAQLWPYVMAGAMSLLGTSFGVYAGVMVAATSATMLAVFATFRRVAGSALLALALFVPFLATSFFLEQGTFANRYGPSNLFTLFPIRYGGAYLLAWLVARRLGGSRPRGDVTLFLIAGLVAHNNPEFGAPASAATAAATLWTLPQPSRRSVGRLAAAIAAGAAGAAVLVALVTLAVSGSLPRLSLLFEFSRIYGVEGFGMIRMAVLGFHLVVYATFAAALVLATVRVVQREQDVVLTGLLCWIGVFGLGAGGYYAGRSHPEVLIDLFSPWAFAIALLMIAIARAVALRPRRLPTLAELAVLLCFGLAVCSIAQTPAPWSQLSRLSRTTQVRRFRPLALERFVRAHTRPGDRVMILAPMGHRAAYDVGVVDMFPYAHMESAPAVEQWDDVMRVLAEGKVRYVFAPTEIHHTAILRRPFQETIVEGIQAAGFHRGVAQSASLHMIVVTR